MGKRKQEKIYATQNAFNAKKREWGHKKIKQKAPRWQDHVSCFFYILNWEFCHVIPFQSLVPITFPPPYDGEIPIVIIELCIRF